MQIENVWEAGFIVSLSVIATLAAAILVAQRRIAVLVSLAEHDELTGLFNRRASLTRAYRSFHSRGDARKFAVAMIDLDYFKSINDRFGHGAGDLLLRHFASLTRASVRSGDFVGRIGGEEFLIVMPDADAETARLVVERLRTATRALPLTFGDNRLSISFSAGVAYVEPQDDGIDGLIQRADGALYAAKNSGRDRVLVAAA
jgi:diguanylate cyclase (GGDEF)-like protein